MLKPQKTSPVKPVAVGEKLPDKNADKIAKAQQLKEEGNKFFKKREWKNAIRKYHHGLMYVRGIIERYEVPGLQNVMRTKPTPEETAMAEKITTTLSNNLAGSSKGYAVQGEGLD